MKIIMCVYLSIHETVLIMLEKIVYSDKYVRSMYRLGYTHANLIEIKNKMIVKVFMETNMR